MEANNLQEYLNPDQDSLSEVQISQDLFQKLSFRESSQFDDEVEEEEEKEDEEEEEEEEFSFMSGGANSSPIAAEDAFADGQIKTVFPLFNRDLLLSISNEDLPMKPPVQKVFVEMLERGSDQVTSSTSGNDEISGPYCDLSSRKAVEVAPAAEACQKSNSTGFSKIWRFKDFMGRSNSDGRDAFVFFNNGQAPPPAAEKPAGVGVERKEKTVNVSGKVKKVSKGKTASISAHEVYLKSKAKEERRRSYLPYRPELMGFFTNVNGGLTKNVHPY